MSPPQFDRIASVTIQGGAVYGLSLLGQLQAVLDEGYEVVALAGTSAGAIVATLYWAGLKTSEIRDFFEERSTRPDGVTALLGGFGAGRDRFAPDALGRLTLAAAGAKAVWAELTTGPWWARAAAWGALPLHAVVRFPTWLRAARDVRQLTRAASSGGLFAGDEFERMVDDLIRRSPRVAPHVKSGRLPAAGPLTFGHLWGLLEAAEEFFPALTLTATNLCTGGLELFDSTHRRYADVPVATAVRASGGFPFFFRPVEIALPDRGDPEVRRAHSFADGGVICNFPAFVFSRWIRREQLGASPIYQAYTMRPWVNLGLRLTDPPAPHPGPLRTLGGVTRGVWGLLVAGTRTHLETALAESTVERLAIASQPFDRTGWPHGLLDFDGLTPQLVRVLYDRGRQFARAAFAELRYELPPAAEVEPRMAELVWAACGLLGDPANATLRVRATLFVPEEFDLVLAYRANMDDTALDRDRDLRFGYWQGLVGHCFVRRRPVVCNMQRLAKAFREEPATRELFGFTGEMNRLVRPDRTWLLSVPVFDPETADPYPYGDNPVVGVEGLHYSELDSPLDGALFGVLSLDAGFDYDMVKVSPDPGAQAADPRVRAVRDVLAAAAWDLGKVFAAYFAAAPDGGDDDGP